MRRALFPSFQADGGADRPEARGTAPAGAGDPQSVAAELETLRASARAEAFEAAAREGRAAAHAEWAARLAALAESLAEAGRRLAACREEFVTEAERGLPRLVFLLVRKVLNHELTTPEASIESVVRIVAERIAGCDRPVALRLSPPEADVFHATSVGQGVRVDADPTLGRGEWMLETGDGFLDGRIEAQLEEAWRLFGEMDK